MIEINYLFAQIQTHLIYLTYVLLYSIAIGVLLSIKRFNGKGWLMLYLVVECILELYNYLLYLLVDVLKIKFDSALYKINLPFYLINSIVFIGFILALKQAGNPPLWRILFSFRGRVRRQFFWIVSIVLGIANISISMILQITLNVPDDNSSGMADSYIAKSIIVITCLLWLLTSSLILLATQVKRWHDLDKSGWWVLIGLIPIIGGLWALIETGFIKGLADSNRFGPAPLISSSDVIRS